MVKYHISDGVARKCDATKRPCPVGASPSEHYQSKAEAYAAYAAQNAHNLFALGTNSGLAAKVKRFVAVGGVLASMCSVAACGTIDTDETPEWKAIEQQQSDAQGQADREKANDGYGKVKDAAKDKWGKVKEKAGKVGQDLKDATSQTDGGGSGGIDGNSGAGGDDVFFHGESLTPTAEEIQQAKDNLAGLKVAPENDASGYNRKEMFGDFDRGTVAAVEQRDVTYNASFNDDGRAEDGSAFRDPYTGKVVTIVKGSSHDADVDHGVPLKEVVQSEDPEHPLSAQERHQIANDMDNLQLVGSHENRSKGDKDPATYIPSYEPAQCKYIIYYVSVKAKYHLRVDPAEKKRIQEVLVTKCS